MRENRRSPVRDGHVRAGEVGLCRNSDEPAERWKMTSGGGWGEKVAAEVYIVAAHILLARAGMYRCFGGVH